MESETRIKNEDIQLLKEKVLKYQDFPKPGIVFYDIFSILANPLLSEVMYRNSVIVIEEYLKKSNKEFNVFIGLESRGFLLGAVLAEKFKVGFVPIRKKSQKNTKLPGKLLTVNYTTEYSEDSFDLQEISINKDSKVILVDDLVATGGSLQATEKLVNLAGGQVVGTFCIFEITDLKGKEKLKDPSSFVSLISL